MSRIAASDIWGIWKYGVREIWDFSVCDWVFSLVGFDYLSEKIHLAIKHLFQFSKQKILQTFYHFSKLYLSFPDFFQVWKIGLQISRLFQEFKTLYEPCLIIITSQRRYGCFLCIKMRAISMELFVLASCCLVSGIDSQ